MDLPKSVPFLVFEYRLDWRTELMVYPDQGIASEVIKIQQLLRRHAGSRDEARIATCQ
jgi:hypothetical protein